MSWIQQIDFMILEWIQSHLQGAALDLLMPTITALGNGGWLFILLALVLLLSKRYRRQGCALAVSLLLCLLVGNLFLKPLFARLRPFEVAGLSELLISPPTDYSFPSGHTMASFACAGVFWHYRRNFGRWSVVLLILAALIGFSRLYLYVHFPTDVLCGALLGLVFAALAAHLCDRAGACRMQKGR